MAAGRRSGWWDILRLDKGLARRLAAPVTTGQAEIRTVALGRTTPAPYSSQILAHLLDTRYLSMMLTRSKFNTRTSHLQGSPRKTLLQQSPA